MTADSTPTPAPPPVIRRAEPASLIDSPFHKRTNWGDKRDFAKSIAENGILQRIVCRIPHDNPNALEIVFGHRRKLGAVTAGLAFVDVEVREMTDDEVIEAQYRENADRELSHPLDEAHQFHLLTEQFAHDLRTLARRVQKPVSFIRERLRLLRLSPKCRKAYGDGALTHDQARRIAMIPASQQQNVLWEAIKDKRISNDADMNSWIRRHVLAPLDEDSVEWALNDKTMPKADGKPGSCNDCPNRTGKQPDLFPDIAGAADMCAVPKCWQGKMDHAYERAATLAVSEEYEVVDRNPDLTFLVRHGARPMVARSSGYVDPEGDCPLMPGSTWEAAVATAGFTPERALLRDQDGRPRVLYVERSVAAPIRNAVRHQPESAAAKAEAAADPARATMRAAKDARNAKETELVKAVIASSGVLTDNVMLTFTARRIVAPATVKAVAKAGGLDPESIFAGDPGWSAGAGAERTLPTPRTVLVALLVAEVGVSAEPPDELRAVATLVGVSLSGAPVDPVERPVPDAVPPQCEAETDPAPLEIAEPEVPAPPVVDELAPITPPPAN
jgi:ParB/RepB/Spo0J family partition protein